MGARHHFEENMSGRIPHVLAILAICCHYLLVGRGAAEDNSSFGRLGWTHQGPSTAEMGESGISVKSTTGPQQPLN